MKLFLSSQGIGARPEALAEFVGSGGRCAVVLNAADERTRGRRKLLDRNFGALQAVGFECEDLDLREYFRDFQGLQTRLEGSRLVWVAGGNTFVLAMAMAASRFDEAISPLLRTDSIVYGGYSAGACVVGPDLDGCHLMDDASILPRRYPAGIPATALGWVPFRIIPHWRSEHEESSSAELAFSSLRQSGVQFQALRDGEVVLVDEPYKGSP